MNNNETPEYIRGTMGGMTIMGVIALLLYWFVPDAFEWAMCVWTFIMFVGHAYETDKAKRIHTDKRKNDE